MTPDIDNITLQSSSSPAGDSLHANVIRGALCTFVRRTKIVVTLGPTSNSPEMLEQLILAGINVTRPNFSHGTPGEYRACARPVRELAAKHGHFVALLGDLQGSEVRITKFANKRIGLQVGDRFRFSTSHVRNVSTREVVGIDHPDLMKDYGVSDELLLDDDRVVMVIEEIAANKLRCRVLIGGPLSDRKGINRRNNGLTALALIDKDKVDIKLAVDIDLDYVTVSFPRDAKGMECVRRLLTEAGDKARLVARIECAKATADDDALDGLTRTSDTVMMARGDLGAEIGDTGLVGTQKKIILYARRNNKVVITMTQTMEPTIHSPMLTHAEIFDMANAVLSYTDAVMLSAENAAGGYLVETMKAMAYVCQGAEKHPTSQKSSHRLGQTFDYCDESITLASMYTANHFPGIKAIIYLTESGFIPLIMSCIRSSVPVYTYSPHRETQACMAMLHGMGIIPFDPTALPTEKASQTAADELLKRGVVIKGDWMIPTKGDSYTTQSGINTMKVLHVGGLLV